MKLTCVMAAALAVASLLRVPAAAGTVDNSVLFWNEQALNATRLARNPPPVASVNYAAMHAAIFDALNGITRTHHGWACDEAAPAGVDPDAAVAAAASTVLHKLWGQAANPRNVELAYAQALAAVPPGPARDSGIAWGRHVAELVLARRATSGTDRVATGPFASTEPGRWRETPPGFRPPVLPQWAGVTPYVLTSPDQFRAPPPPAFDSEQAAAELAQIGRVGRRDGAERTEYETLGTAFWADDLGTATPPGHWNVIAQDLARRHRLSTLETARLFALLNLACADAGIACWDTKFHYRTWRPETALRELTPALNPHLVPQPDFIPLMPSPAFPSYVSGHSTFSGAAERILQRYFGTDDIEFTVTSEGLPGAVRTFKKLSECQREIGMSRLFGGIHVMADNLEGTNLGHRVGDWVFDHALARAE
ncbi:MAG TPA: vanadium-dependent haloperoxidase [Lacunisphaera sp.]|nr:vanadium-dependent haloperoxidase [Lacunisphaera sp.]